MQNDRAGRVDVALAGERRGPHEHGESEKSHDYAGDDDRARTLAVWAKPLDENHPERNNGHEQRGDARRNSLLGPDTAPLPQQSISAPVTVASRHWAAVGRGDPRQRAQAKRITPETAKRVPTITNGGIVWTA